MAKTLYEILMVDRSADLIIIEAAYRRLAREYHPDVNKQANAHQKMVEINQAYAILKDSTTRAEYDRSLDSTTVNKTSRPQAPLKCPMPPNPRTYGISPAYYERAMEGALAWKQRRKVAPTPMAFALAIALSWIGAVLGNLSSQTETKWLSSICSYAWLLLPLAEWGLLVKAQNVLDARLKRDKFDPEYNPNPTGYMSYAQELARYQTEISEVNLTATGTCFHTYSSCSSYQFVRTMPMYEAVQRGYSACSRCAKYRIPPKQLPYPFGDNIHP